MLLEQGFTAGQLGWLVYSGFAKLRRGGGPTSTKAFRVKITAAGQRAIAATGAAREGERD
jgi:hypothetical protein